VLAAAPRLLCQAPMAADGAASRSDCCSACETRGGAVMVEVATEVLGRKLLLIQQVSLLLPVMLRC
jgi:hypothetical protein